MTCGDVLNWLTAGGADATTRDHVRALPPELESHLAWCSHCRGEVAAFARFEGRLEQGLVDWVDGVADAPASPSERAEIDAARQRLQTLLDSRWSETTTPPANTPPATTQPATAPARRPSSRGRLTRRVLSVVAATLLVALFASLWLPSSRVERIVIERSTLSASARLLAASSPYQGVLPATFDSTLLQGAVSAYADASGLRVEVLRFAFRRRSRVIEGRLLVVPARWLADVPQSASFPNGPLRYTDQFAATWWIEGDYAFACCLTTADEAAFRSLLPRRLTT